MTLFLFVGLDQPDSKTKRDALRLAHRQYIAANPGPVVLAGVLLDSENRQRGSLYIFDVSDEADATAWLNHMFRPDS